MRVAINGFGRIGRAVLRRWLQEDDAQLDIVNINDLIPIDNACYLLQYDSVHGMLDLKCHTDGDEIIITKNSKQLRINRHFSCRLPVLR